MTDRGRSILALSPNILEALRLLDPAHNPFVMSTSERIFFLYLLLDSDGDLIAHLYRRLLQRERFARAEAGEALADALASLREERLGRTTTGMGQEAVRKMRQIENTIRKQGGREGMGARESFATPRIEPLVDCGVLSKPSKGIYSYEFTADGKRFLRGLTEAPSAHAFIQSRFAAYVVDVTKLAGTPNDQRTTMKYVARGYGMIRHGLGYVSVRELAALAIALAASDSISGFEISDVEEAVLETARDRGAKFIRVTKSRGGVGSYQVRFSHALLEELV